MDPQDVRHEARMDQIDAALAERAQALFDLNRKPQSTWDEDDWAMAKWALCAAGARGCWLRARQEEMTDG